MILTCPECATSYFVDDGKIGPSGRAVRCASCGARWTAHQDVELELTPEPASAEAVAASAVEAKDLPAEALPKVFRARAEAKRNVKAAAATGVIWAVLAALLLILLGAAYIFRVDVVRLWPRAASAYAAVHLPVNPTGLEFEGVGARAALKDGHAALVVTGKIRNVKAKPLDTPALKITLLDKAGKPVLVKIVDPENARIPPGEVRHFLVNVLDPPVSATDIDVVFVLDHKPVARAAGQPTANEKVQLRGPLEPTEPSPVAAATLTPAATALQPIDAKPLPIQAIPMTPEPVGPPARR